MKTKKEKEKEQIDTKEIDKRVISILENSILHDNTENTNVKDLETIKIVLTEILGSNRHLKSTTVLSKEQVIDISKAYSLNKIYRSKLIGTFLECFMELQRSKTSESKDNDNFLSKILKLTNNDTSVDDDRGNRRIFGNRLF